MLGAHNPDVLTRYLKRLHEWLYAPPGTDTSAALRAAECAVEDVTRHHKLDDTWLVERLNSTDERSLPLFLGVMSELAFRTLGLRPHLVQLWAAASMLGGISVEMPTGEGKTLVGAIVAAGLARRGLRTHVLCANDYLARRDAEWMSPLLGIVGHSPSCVTSASSRESRREAYGADITYVPVAEAGFDTLRDRLVLDAADRVGVGRGAAAVLDEADAVLLDEARVPLVLAGETSANSGAGQRVATFVAGQLVEGEHYVVPDPMTVHLTDHGVELAERELGVVLYGDDPGPLTRLNLALHAQALLRRDVDYVVVAGEVQQVSQSLGRVERTRRWPDGLQAAVEAKEGLAASSGVRILDQLLVRDLIRAYTTTVGMSATLTPAADELYELYGLPVARIPPDKPCIRSDEEDRVYDTLSERDAAVLAEVQRAHLAGQPVLVATQSVEESDAVAAGLRGVGLSPVVLNALNDAQEAEIIARAGELGSLTVSTQMAGRGTDIRLGEGASDRGGLYVLGVSRFRTRRLDDQLRGRAGRQGDPGRSVFFVSLDDDLVIDSGDALPPVRRCDEDGRLHDRRLLRIPDHAQAVAEGEQQALRSLSRRYGLVVEAHRRQVLELRELVLVGDEGWRRLRPHLDPARARLLERSATRASVARTSLLLCLDRAWSDHLAYAAGIREGIHLQALAGLDPLTEYGRMLDEAFRTLVDRSVEDAAELINTSPVVGGEIELDAADLRPGATWTYTVSDDHFGTVWERIARHLTGKPLRK